MRRTQTGGTSADAPAGDARGSSVAAVIDPHDGVAAAPRALAPSPTGRPESRWLRHLAASGVAVALLALSATALGVARRLPTGLALGDVVWAAAWTLYAVVGGFLALRRPRHPVGWLFLAAGVLVPVASLLDAGGMLLAADGRAQVAGLLHTASEALWIPALVLGLPLALAHFPDGRPLSPRWAWGGPRGLGGRRAVGGDRAPP